ncbi:MAG: hypothetical protein ACRDG4_13005 [Chloroflexota bacterium]
MNILGLSARGRVRKLRGGEQPYVLWFCWPRNVEYKHAGSLCGDKEIVTLRRYWSQMRWWRAEDA